MRVGTVLRMSVTIFIHIILTDHAMIDFVSLKSKAGRVIMIKQKQSGRDSNVEKAI